MRPYLRLARIDRPIGWWLLMWPCWWSAALVAVATAPAAPNPWHLALFMIGAIAMRGAGSTWNDVMDRDVDGQVERTRNRPIPSGQVSVKAALAFIVLQCAIGLAVVLQFNGFTIALSFSSLAIVAVYPLMKRFFWWPQSVLGLAFSWGALVGWSATAGSLGLAPLLAYAAAWAWIIGYDTIYGHQDKRDDAIIGIKSTSRLFGANTKAWLVLFYAATVALLLAAGWAAGAGVLSYLGLAAFAAHLAWQIWTLDIDDASRCLALFRSNRDAGALPFVGFAADAVLRLIL